MRWACRYYATWMVVSAHLKTMVAVTKDALGVPMEKIKLNLSPSEADVMLEVLADWGWRAWMEKILEERKEEINA